MTDLRIAVDAIHRIQALVTHTAWEQTPHTQRLQNALTAEVATALWNIVDLLAAIHNAMPRED